MTAPGETNGFTWLTLGGEGVSVEFRLLGDVEARVDGRPVDIGHVRQRCVLVALLVERGRAIPADQLIEHVWAGRLPHNARNALSAYVSRLRRVLAVTDQVEIVRGPGGYAIDVDSALVDLHRFTDLVGRARSAGSDEDAAGLFAQAFGLWRGEPFATLDTPWINAARDRVVAQRLLAEADRNDVELRLGRHVELLSELPARAKANPLDERLAGQLMLALYRSGRQSESLSHYEQVRRRLADELGVDPTGPLRELHQRIVSSDPALAIPSKAVEVAGKGLDTPANLLERSTLLASLDTTLEAGSGGWVALVSGEAGIGKSVLVQQFVRRHSGGARFLVGLCDPLLTPRVLGPLRDIAEQVGGQLEQRFAAGAPRDEVFSAFLDELGSYDGPQVVVVEDAHWADEATMDLLTLLGRRLDRLRTMLVVTYRDDELGPDHPLRKVLSVLPPNWTVHVRPTPLSVTAVAELARQAGRSATGLHAVTDGNPLLVTEMLTASEAGVPATVRDLALARFAALEREAQDVVRFVAVNPTRTELWLLKEALGPDASMVEAGVEGGLLVLTDDAVGFRHELIRQAVEESLSSLRHADLNRLALDVLSGVPEADLARLVHHARQAGDVPALLRYAPLAAKEAEAAGAHREAVDHYRVALHHAHRLPDAQRAELLEGYAFSAHLVGLSEEALTARLTALEIWQAAGQARKVGENWRWLSRLYWWTGRHDEAEATAARAIEALEPDGASRELALAYSNQGDWDLLDGKLEPAIEWSLRAIEVARQMGDQETIAHALAQVGTARLQGGDLSGRVELEEAVELAIAEGLPDYAVRAMLYAAFTSVEIRDYEQARADTERGIAFANEHDLAGYGQYLLGMRAIWRLDQGLWAEAEQDTTDAVGQSAQPGVRVAPALYVLSRLHVRRGDAKAADTLAVATESAQANGVWQLIALVAAARAEHALLNGLPDQAVAEAAAAYEMALRARQPWLTGELAWWMHRAGQRPDVPVWIAEPYWLMLSGNWRAAAEAWQRMGCPYEQAEALACGDAAAVRRAQAILDRLGAVPAARKLRLPPR